MDENTRAQLDVLRGGDLAELAEAIADAWVQVDRLQDIVTRMGVRWINSSMGASGTMTI